MKNYLIFVFTFLFLGTGCYAQVGINSTNTPPNSSAMLDVSSTSKGVLIPRMNTIQKNAIPNKTEGLMVYDYDVKQFSYWTGTLWVNFGNSVSAGPGWSQSGSEITNTNTGVVKINSPTNFATNAIFGSNGAGISLQKGNPVIGFNQYRDANNAQRYMTDGHAMSLLVSPYWGNMIWNVNPSGLAGNLTSSENTLMILSNSGRLGIGIGDDTPQEKLTIGTSPNNYGMLHTSGSVSVGSYVSGVSGAMGTKTNHPFNLFANNSAAAMTIETNANVTIAKGFYAAGTGSLNLAPLGVFKVACNINDDGDMSNMIITNLAGNVINGGYSYYKFEAVNDFARINLAINSNAISNEYTKIIVLGNPVFLKSSAWTDVTSSFYRLPSGTYTPNDDSRVAFINNGFTIELVTDTFVNGSLTGIFTVYGIK